jgi:hypothetical protein
MKDGRLGAGLAVCAVIGSITTAVANPRIDRDSAVLRQERLPGHRTSDVTAEQCPLKITDVRIENHPPERKGQPSLILKFHAANESASTLTSIVFAISLIEAHVQEQRAVSPKVLAGPFIVRGDVVLEPRYSADYEMILRNISRDCGCAAEVRVLSLRYLGDIRNFHSSPRCGQEEERKENIEVTHLCPSPEK